MKIVVNKYEDHFKVVSDQCFVVIPKPWLF